MRNIQASEVTKAVRRLCIEANCHLPSDVQNRIAECRAQEPWPGAQGILDRIIENYDIANENEVPICQDTGLACVFVEIGQDVHVEGDLAEAINEGVRQGYTDGYLRKSVVRDPIDRVNTRDNTPAMIYYDIVPGDYPAMEQGETRNTKDNEGVKEFVLKVVEDAGPNPCPPIVVGVGVGGTFDKAAYLAKRALVRNIDVRNADPFWADLERELLEKINAKGIGPQGLGGKTTALAVNIEKFATHIASLPVAVNINCHVTRHKSEVI